MLSLQPLLQLPGSYSPADYTMEDDQGYMQGELRLLVGYSNAFRNVPYFLNNEIAYRSALNGEVDEWRIDNTLGVRILPRWMALMQLFSIYRPEGITQTARYSTSNAWGDSQTVEYPLFYTHFDTIAQISVVHPLTNTLSLQLGAFSHIIEGEEWIGKGVLVSVWVNF